MIKGLVFVFIVAALVYSCTAATVMSVDIGSQSIKIGVMRGNTREVIMNPEGNRKTINALGLSSEGHRLFNKAADAQLRRDPSRVAVSPTEYLGRAQVLDSNVFLEDDSHQLHFLLDPQVSLNVSAISATGMILKKAKDAASHHVSGNVRDVILVVPSHWSIHQRRHLLEAADVAGLNVLSLMNQGAAAATSYFLNRFAGSKNETHNVVVYDMGHKSTSVTLMKFFREYNAKTDKHVPKARVLDYTWDETLGGGLLDNLIAKQLVKLVQQEHPSFDPQSNAKGYQKLLRGARNAKEALSANREIGVFVEGLLPNYDFKTRISRKQLEQDGADVFDRVLLPLKTLLQRNDMDVSSLTALELIGGSTRVPRVRSIIAEYMGRQDGSVDTHLNGDDALAEGGVFYGSMKSAAFPRQSYTFRDVTLYPIDVHLPAHTELDASEDDESMRVFSLYPYKNRLYSKKVVSFPLRGNRSSLALEVHYSSNNTGLPSGEPLPLYAFNITGLTADISQRYNMSSEHTPELSIAFRLTSSATVKIESAELEIKYWKVPKRPKKPKVVADVNATNTTGANETVVIPSNSTEEEEEEELPPMDPILKTKRVIVNVDTKDLSFPKTNSDRWGAIKAQIRKFERDEADRRAYADAANDLESFIYSTRESLEEDEDIIKHSTEFERQEIMDALEEAEEWSEDMDTERTTSDFKSKLRKLKKPYTKIQDRSAELKALPIADKKCRKEIRSWRRKIFNITAMRKVTEEEYEKVQSDLNATLAWLEEKREEQKDLPITADPVYTARDVDKKCQAVCKDAKRLTWKPKKKKKPVVVEEPQDGESEREEADQAQAEEQMDEEIEQ